MALEIATYVVLAAGLTACILLMARKRATARALSTRVQFAVLPAETFDPKEEEVIRFAHQLSRVHRAVLGFLDSRASAVRIRLESTSGGQLAYIIEGPARAASVLRLATYPGVELRPHEPAAPQAAVAAGEPEDGGDGGGGDLSSPPRGKRTPHVARAELILARDGVEPLRNLGLRPDPLAAFARAFRGLRGDLGEEATVALDLLPLSSGRRRRLRRALAGSRNRRGASGLWDQILLGLGHPRRHHPPGRSLSKLETADNRSELRDISAKVLGTGPMFALQVLIRTQSQVPGRPLAHLQALISCFEQFADRNWFRVAGQNLRVAFLGADAFPWRRQRFDQRLEQALFAPRRFAPVTAQEVAAFLKPPTAYCAEPNVIRSGGVIPPPPRELPEFRRQPDVLPLGRVETEDGSRTVGVFLGDTLFSYFCGRSRFGKTETALNQFIHLARSGHGCFFLDPHEDAINRVKPYLTGLADRVIEVNLAPRGRSTRQAAWNLFSMEGRSPEDKEARVAAVVDSFASALRWGEINNRALALTTMAAQTLVELALVLPPGAAPTIFQVSTLLSNDSWREAVLPFVSQPSREFWTSRFPRLGAEAITPVTNLIDRLRSSAQVTALLGASRSSYDVRRAMDRGMVVLACPAGNGDKDRLVANFLVYDVLQAALSRKDTPPERRRPFYVFFDEVQTYDGASRGNLAALLEQAAKYGVRAFLLNQNPERLTPATFDAVTTNCSHLAATVVNARAASIITREWGGAVSPQVLTRLEKYTYLASVTLGRRVIPPFLLRGLPLEELWEDCHDPEGVSGMERSIDRNTHRRPLGETIARLETLDERILEELEHLAPARIAESAGTGRVRRDHVRFDPVLYPSGRMGRRRR